MAGTHESNNKAQYRKLQGAPIRIPQVTTLDSDSFR